MPLDGVMQDLTHSIDSPSGFRAQLIWLGPGKPMRPGILRVSGSGKIQQIDSCASAAAPAIALLPGLVNAHVHLQIPSLARAEQSFRPWIDAVIAQRQHLGDADHSQLGALALQSLLQDGVTAVGEVDSTGMSPALLRALPLAGRCYQELLGFDLGQTEAQELLQQRQRPATDFCSPGLSPHAPYSISPALLRAATASGAALTMHVAESQEEQRFLMQGDGPLRELLESLGRLPADYQAIGMGAVQWLESLQALSPRCLLVHGQHLSAGEEELIRQRQAPLVVCPGTIRYFQRQPPPVPRWLAAGMTVALGTDSLASNTQLSVRHEMRLAREMWPELSPAQILDMATRQGGEALSRSGLGSLQLRQRADFQLVPIPDGMKPEAFLDAYTRAELPPGATYLGGVCGEGIKPLVEEPGSST